MNYKISFLVLFVVSFYALVAQSSNTKLISGINMNSSNKLPVTIGIEKFNKIGVRFELTELPEFLDKINLVIYDSNSFADLKNNKIIVSEGYSLKSSGKFSITVFKNLVQNNNYNQRIGISVGLQHKINSDHKLFRAPDGTLINPDGSRELLFTGYNLNIIQENIKLIQLNAFYSILIPISSKLKFEVSLSPAVTISKASTVYHGSSQYMDYSKSDLGEKFQYYAKSTGYKISVLSQPLPFFHCHYVIK
ncbi:MAG: hypothetical protein JNL57_00255 [Bacteroidetes bacterium]|nr:hypothetical protein [Bacteroidota bacterium]